MVMKYTARLRESGMARFALGMDLRALMKNVRDLKEGRTTKLAEELRAKAQEIQRELTELTKLYERLKQKVSLCLPLGCGCWRLRRWNRGAWAPQGLREGC